MPYSHVNQTIVTEEEDKNIAIEFERSKVMQTIPFKPQENFVLSDSEAELEASHPIKKRNLKKQSVLSDFPKQTSKLMKSGDGEIAKLKKSI